MNVQEIRDLYGVRARHYNVTSHLYGVGGYRLHAYRRRGIDLLRLVPGDTVVEIGCGTGANFADLEAAVGPSGRIIGVDLTRAMLNQARARIRRRGWSNVTLVECNAVEYAFPDQVRGVLSTFALTLVPDYDDVIRNAARALVGGSRFVVVDFRAPDGWPDGLLRAIVPLFRPFGVTFDLRTRHPWESLAKHLHLVSMEERYFGTTYIAAGEKPRS